MKNIGVWLDKEKAYVVTVGEEEVGMMTIESDMEFFNPKGGSRSKTRWGPQDVVQDSKYLEREKHQHREYFKKIIAQLRKADQIVLYGPAETYERLLKELQQNYPEIAKRIRDVSSADSMTINQIKAKVRDYYIPSARSQT